MNLSIKQTDVIAGVLDAAVKMGVCGVGICLVLPNDQKNTPIFTPTFIVVGDKTREPDLKRGPDDTGTNYIATACSKLAEMLDTYKNSGTMEGRRPKKGELGYKGGIVREYNDLLIFVVFSGGTPEEDLNIARLGLQEVTGPPSMPPHVG